MSSKRTINDLREILFDQIDLLKKEKITLAKAREIRRTAQTILDSAHVEIKYNKEITFTKPNKKIESGTLTLVNKEAKK